MVAAYLAYTVGFQYMANLPIEKELYLGVAARFWMQSDVAAGFIMGVGAAFVIAWISGLAAPAAERDARAAEAGAGAGTRARFRGGGNSNGRGRGVGGGRGGGDVGGGGGGGGGDGGRGIIKGAGGVSCGGGGGGKRRTVELAALGVALSLLAARVLSNFSAMNERDNNMFEDFGHELLRPLPPNARLIVKGDLITNSARFVQRCRHFRRDVQMVDMAMLTYKWFIPVQGANFPSFTWPGTHYHPYEPNGFSMKGLLVGMETKKYKNNKNNKKKTEKLKN